MGKRSNLFTAVKKVLHHESLEKKAQNGSQSKQSGPILLSKEETMADSPRLTPMEYVKLAEAENDKSKPGFTGGVGVAQAAAQTAERVVPLAPVAHYLGKSKEDIAAIKIQTAARGYMARGAFRDMKSLERLKTFIQGKTVQRQATATLKCMQTIVQLQSQIQARRIRMSEENHALQRQLHQRHEKERVESPTSLIQGGWSNGPQSKEQMEATQLYKQEAAMRRERALAYAHSQQQTWKNASKYANPTLMDPNNTQWGWSWMDRWMAARPWENQIPIDHFDHASTRTSAASHAPSVSEINRPHFLREISHVSKPSPAGKGLSRSLTCLPTSTSSPKATTSSSVAGKTKPSNHKGSVSGGGDGSISNTKCKDSVQSKHTRRHSIGQSYGVEDNSPASSPVHYPGRMLRTEESARAKSKSLNSMEFQKNGLLEKPSVGTPKKKLPISDSHAADSRRHSEPSRSG